LFDVIPATAIVRRDICATGFKFSKDAVDLMGVVDLLV